MLEMSRQASVLRHRRPAVVLDHRLVAADIHHRLDGEHHPLPQLETALRLAVIRHRGLFVQAPADPVSDERADDRKAGVLGRLLNGRRELSHALAVSQLLDAAIERLFGDAHQSPRLLAHLSDAYRDGGIAVVPRINTAVVESDDIAFLEPPVPNYGQPESGLKLRQGMVLAIEP